MFKNELYANYPDKSVLITDLDILRNIHVLRYWWCI